MEEVETVETEEIKINRKVILRDKLVKPSSQKNLMLNGKMFQGWKMLKMLLNRPLFYLYASKRYLQEAENPGKESCYMGLLEQEKHS